MIDHPEAARVADPIRFKEGDEVFAARVLWSQVERQCPDCLGRLAWRVELPNGESWTVDCPRCHTGGYDGKSTGISREEWIWEASVERGIVNGVRFDTTREPGEQVEYTFAGSYIHGHGGTIHYDRDVFATKDEALVEAERRAVSQKEAKDKEESRRVSRKRKPKRVNYTDEPCDPNEAHDELRSVAYARLEVRRAQKEIERWMAFAARHGADIRQSKPSRAALTPTPEDPKP